MIARTIQIGALAAAGLFASLGLVNAQGAEADTVAGGEASSSKPAVSNRSPEQVLSDAQGVLDGMETSADNMSRMLRQARVDKDVVKTICLDDKLNQMNVATRSAADRVGSISAAVKSKNAERLQQDDAVLEALKARADELAVEANQCIGEESGTLGVTSLDVTIDPSIPRADTASAPAPIVISAPPVAASPVL